MESLAEIPQVILASIAVEILWGLPRNPSEIFEETLAGIFGGIQREIPKGILEEISGGFLAASTGWIGILGETFGAIPSKDSKEMLLDIPEGISPRIAFWISPASPLEDLQEFFLWFI